MHQHKHRTSTGREAESRAAAHLQEGGVGGAVAQRVLGALHNDELQGRGCTENCKLQQGQVSGEGGWMHAPASLTAWPLSEAATQPAPTQPRR